MSPRRAFTCAGSRGRFDPMPLSPTLSPWGEGEPGSGLTVGRVSSPISFPVARFGGCMRPYLALPILLTLAGPALAQPAAPADPRIEWLRKSAVQIRSISPDDRDFSDLQPLKKILGD